MSQEILFEEEVIDEDEIVPFEPQPFGFRWTHIGWSNPLRRPGDALWPLALRIKKVVFIILLQPLWLLELAYRRLEAFASNLRVSKGRRRKLLTWVQNTAGLEATPSLASVWHDGFVLCSVVRSAVPGACTSPLDPRVHRTVAHAQELALKYLGVPAVFSDEETCQILAPALERRLTAYLQSVQRASSRLRIDPDNPALAVAHSSDEETSKNKISVVIRGMGIVQAVRGRRAVFYIYLLRKGLSVDAQCCASDSSDPDFGDIEIRIQGPQNDFGLALIPSSSYLPANNSTTTSSERRRLRFSLAPWFSTSRCANVPISFRLVEGSNRAVCVCYTPQSAGTYDLSILWRTCHVAGSPYSVMVDENDGRETPTTPERGCSRRRRRSKVVLRVVDFVDEKMLLTDDGKLTAITPANLTLLRRSLSETKERVPFLLCNIMPETTSTDSTGSEGFMQSPHRIRRHRFVEKKRASHSHSLDESQNEKARERYRRLVGLCTLILRHTAKHKGIKILSAAEQILNGRPVKISEATDLLVQNVLKTLQPQSEVINESPSETNTLNDTSVENTRSIFSENQNPEQVEVVASKNKTLDSFVEKHSSPNLTLGNIVPNCQEGQLSDSDYSTPENEFPTMSYNTANQHAVSELSHDTLGNEEITKIKDYVDIKDVPDCEINRCSERIESNTTVIEMTNKTNLYTEQSNCNDKTTNSKLIDFSLQKATITTCTDDKENGTENRSLVIPSSENTFLHKVENETQINKELVLLKPTTSDENFEHSSNAHYVQSILNNSQYHGTEKTYTDDNISFMSLPNDKTDSEFNLISGFVSPSDNIETEFNSISEELTFSLDTEFQSGNGTDSRKEKEFKSITDPECPINVEASNLINLNHHTEMCTKGTSDLQLEVFEETRQEYNLTKQESLEHRHVNANLSQGNVFEARQEEGNLPIPDVIEDLQEDSSTSQPELFKSSQYNDNTTEIGILGDSKKGKKEKRKSVVFDLGQEQFNVTLPEVFEDCPEVRCFPEIFEDDHGKENTIQLEVFEDSQEDANLPKLEVFDDVQQNGNMNQVEVFEECQHESNMLQADVFVDSQEEINQSQLETFEDTQEDAYILQHEVFKDDQQEGYETQPHAFEECEQVLNMLQPEIQESIKGQVNPPLVDIFDDSQEDANQSQQEVFEDSQEEVSASQSYVLEVDRLDINQAQADVFDVSLHDTDKTIDDIFGIISMESQGSESDNTSNVILNEPNNCNEILSKIYPEEPITKVSDSFISTEINFDGNNEHQCGTSLKKTEFSTEIVDLLSVDCENIIDIMNTPVLGETDILSKDVGEITNDTSNIVNVDDLLSFSSSDLGNSTPAFCGIFDIKVDMAPLESDKHKNILHTSIENEGHVCEIGSEANNISATGNLFTDSASCSMGKKCMADSVNLNLDDFLVDHNTAYVQGNFADTEDNEFRLWTSDVVFGSFPDESSNIDDSMVDFESVIAAPNLEEAMRQLEEGLQKAQLVATTSNTSSPNVSPVNYNSDRTTDEDDRTSNSACDDGIMMQQQGGENDTVDSDYVSMDDNQNSLQRSPESQNTDSPNENEQWKQNRTFDDDNYTKDSYMGPAEREIWGLRDEDSDDESEDVNKRTLRYYNRVLTPKDIQMDSISEENEETTEISIMSDECSSNCKQQINTSSYGESSCSEKRDILSTQTINLDHIQENTHTNEDIHSSLEKGGNVEATNSNTNENKSYYDHSCDEQVRGSVRLIDDAAAINNDANKKNIATPGEETAKKELKEFVRTISIPIIVIEDVDMVGIFKTFPPHVDGDIFNSADDSSGKNYKTFTRSTKDLTSNNELKRSSNISMSKEDLSKRSIKMKTRTDIRDAPSSSSISEFDDQKSAHADRMHNVLGGSTTAAKLHSTINVDGSISEVKSHEQNNSWNNPITDGKSSPPPLSLKLKQLSECFQHQESSPVHKEEVVPSSQKVSNLKQYWDVNVNYQKRSDSPDGNERSVRKIPLRRLEITSNSLASTKSKKRRSPSIRIPGIVSKWKKIFEQSQFKVSKSPNTTGHESISKRSNRIMQWRKYWDSIGDENQPEKNSSVRCHSVMETRPSKFVNHPKRSYTPDAAWSKKHSLSELLGLDDSEIQRDIRKPKSFARRPLKKSLFLKKKEEASTKTKEDLENVSSVITTAQNAVSRDTEKTEPSQLKECIVDLVLAPSTEGGLTNAESNLSTTSIHGKEFTDSKLGKCTSQDIRNIPKECTNDSDSILVQICNSDNKIPDNSVCTDTTTSNLVTIINETENNEKVKEYNINLEQRIAKFKNAELMKAQEDCQDIPNANLVRKVCSDGKFSPVAEASKVTDIPENTVIVGKMSVIFEGKQQHESSIWPKTIVNNEEKVSVNKLASIFAEKQQEPSLFRATRVRVSEEGITSSRFATPENLSTKDDLADLSRDTSNESEPRSSITCSSPTPPESSLRHLILDTRQGSSSPSLPTTASDTPDTGCKTRFERAKTFFRSLERNTPPPKASGAKGNAWVDTAESQDAETLQRRNRRPGNKIHSAPTSDTESLSRMSSGRLFLTSRGPGGSERAPKVSERFHVKDLFRDVVGSERTETTAGLRGIPHQQAVLAALRAVGEDSRPVSPYEELRSSPEPDEDHSRSPVPCEFQQEYPYLPNTPANLYRPRAALLTPTLIRRSELLRSE